MSSALAADLAERSYAIEKTYQHSGRLEYLILQCPHAEKHRPESEKLRNFMISLHVPTVLVSGKHIWYRARAARPLLLQNNQCLTRFYGNAKQKRNFIQGRNTPAQMRIHQWYFANLSSPLVCVLRKRPEVNGIKKHPCVPRGSDIQH